MSVADAVDHLEHLRQLYHPKAIEGIIKYDLLPTMKIADEMREAAQRIETDGTPSQVGPTADDLRRWADLIRQLQPSPNSAPI